MGFNSIGFSGLILILVVVLLLFGPSKLPELGRAFGRTLREFKEGARELMDDAEDPKRKEGNGQQLQNSQESQTNNEQDRRLPD